VTGSTEQAACQAWLLNNEPQATLLSCLAVQGPYSCCMLRSAQQPRGAAIASHHAAPHCYHPALMGATQLLVLATVIVTPHGSASPLTVRLDVHGACVTG
jgi:hypothetical protein